MAIFGLHTRKREAKKTVSTKQLRIQGEIPAIYYRKDAPSVSLLILQKEMEALLKTSSHLVRLDIEGDKSVLAVFKEVQRDPVTQKALHMSFEGIKEGEMIHVSLPVKLDFKENCQWMKEHGRLMQKVFHLHVEVQPHKMPELITIDINHLHVGSTLHISDLKVPGMKFLDNSHTEVVNIAHFKIIKEEPVVVKEVKDLKEGKDSNEMKDPKESKEKETKKGKDS